MKNIVKKISKIIIILFVWLLFVYIGRVAFFAKDSYRTPAWIYYQESLKDFDELREYIKNKEIEK